MPSNKILNPVPASITITIEDQDFPIKLPNMGQIIDIESNKQLYSNNMYPSLVKSTLMSASVAVGLIELSAVFSVMIPNFKSLIKAKSIFDLDIYQTKKLLREYNNKFIPWYSSILDELSDLEDDEEQLEESDENETKEEKPKENED